MSSLYVERASGEMADAPALGAGKVTLVRVRVPPRARDFRVSIAPVVQLDRMTDFYSVGRRFESCREHHILVTD